jgi:hypothetical protein
MANSAVVEFRSRGITAQDVWQAADALLLEGARPTIERVRQKIGRGSPNTVSQHLDAWFGKLGARIKDPMAFSAPPSIPDPVQQAAAHFWDAALAQTRLDFDERLRVGLADAVANIEAEKERASIAEAAAFEASAKSIHLQSEVGRLQAALGEQQGARAQAEAHLAEARRVVDQLRGRLDQALAETAAVRKSSERSIAEAIDRFTAAERRAALEIDNERVARGKAEKSAATLERRLEAAQSEAHAAAVRHAKQVSELQAALEQTGKELTRNSERLDALESRADEQRGLLAQARADAQTSRAEAALATRLASTLRHGGAKSSTTTKRVRKRAA